MSSLLSSSPPPPPAIHHIQWLGVAWDGILLASHAHWAKGDPSLMPAQLQNTLSLVFTSPGWSAVRDSGKRKVEITSPLSRYCMEMEGRPDSAYVYCAIVGSSYPTHYIFSNAEHHGQHMAVAGLLSELRDYVRANFPTILSNATPGCATRTLTPFLASLAAKYDALPNSSNIAIPSTTGRAPAGGKAGGYGTAGAPSGGSNRRSEAMPLLGGAGAGSGGVAGFQKRNARRRRLALWFCLAAFVALLLIAAIVAALNYTKFHWW